MAAKGNKRASKAFIIYLLASSPMLSLLNNCVSASREFHVYAADCKQGTLLGYRKPEVQFTSLAPSEEATEESSAYYLLQQERLKEIRGLKIKLELTADLMHCNGQKAAPTINSPRLLTPEMFQQIYDHNFFDYDILEYGEGVFPVHRLHVSESTGPENHRTTGLDASFYPSGSTAVACDSNRQFKVWNQLVTGIVPYASLLFEVAEVNVLFDVIDRVAYLPMGDRKDKVCAFAPGKNHCGNYLPTQGNFYVELDSKESSCPLRKTTMMPSTGNNVYLPSTQKHVITLPEYAMHFQLKGSPYIHPTCKILVQEVVGYDFFLMDTRKMPSRDLPLINSNNFNVRDSIDIKMDYIAFKRARHDETFADMINKEIKHHKQTITESFMQFAATSSDKALIKISETESNTLYYKYHGGAFRETLCPKHRYKVATVDYCSSELAVHDNGTIRYVTYPEMAVIDNYTRVACDDLLCQVYEVADGQVIKQCPHNRLASDISLKPMELSPTALDNYTAEYEDKPFGQRGIYGDRILEPTYRQVTGKFIARSVMSQAAENVFPSFMSGGKLDGSGPFNSILGYLKNPAGVLGLLSGLLTGGFQNLMMLGITGVLILWLIRKVRGKDGKTGSGGGEAGGAIGGGVSISIDNNGREERQPLPV